MRKRLFYVVNLLWLSIGMCLLYYLLVKDNYFHLSIAGFMALTNQFARLGHICIIGFLPIYLGLIIFGVALLFLYIRSHFRILLKQYNSN